MILVDSFITTSVTEPIQDQYESFLIRNIYTLPNTTRSWHPPLGNERVDLWICYSAEA